MNCLNVTYAATIACPCYEQKAQKNTSFRYQ